MIDRELIFIDLEPGTREEIIGALADKMLAAGKVKDTYLKAVLEREEAYPTGLPLEGVNIAMPHTFAEHVIESAIAMARLKKPVGFYQMGTKDVLLDVQLVLMMAVKNPKQQLGMLKKIMGLFSNKEVLAQALQSSTPDELYEALRRIDE